jgi:uncharacterized protein
MKIKKLINGLLVAAGVMCVGLGILGMFLPLLPTTPFLLLSAFCFARGSDRLYQKLLNHRVCGKYINNYRNGVGFTIREKVTALTVLWLSIVNGAWWLGDRIWMKVLLAAVGCGVTIYLVRIKTNSGEEPVRALQSSVDVP